MAQSHIPCNNMCNRDVHSLSVTSRNHPVAFPSSYNKCIYYCTGMKNNIFTLLMQLYSKAEYSCIMKNANDNNHEIWSFLLLNTRLKTRHSFQAKSVFHLCCCYFFFCFLLLMVLSLHKIFFQQRCGLFILFSLFNIYNVKQNETLFEGKGRLFSPIIVIALM